MDNISYIRSVSLIGLIFLFCFSLTHAQDVKTGVRGGINFTNFAGDDSDLETRTGFMIGGFVKMDFPDSPMSIQPEIYYSEKGAEGQKLEYVEVPILFKFGLGEGETVTPNLFLGPYAGINLTQDAGAGGFLGSPDGSAENIDFGGVIGAGLDFEAGSAIFTIDARYSRGFTNVFESGDAKNDVFAIVAGISLPE